MMADRHPLAPDEQLALLRRGTVEIYSEQELLHKLERSQERGEALRVKLGLDPTAPDIHLGHTVVLRKLRQFQELGHQVILVIGSFTAQIGDPSGRAETRKRLTVAEVEANAATYAEQAFKVLDPARTSLVYNHEWLGAMRFADVLELTSKYTVARMLERDEFAKRYAEGRPISVLEFLYPLSQAYDSVAIHADVELGGTDQTFNLLVARDVQREYGQEPEVAVTMPLIPGLDGTQKMSKSLGNYIGVAEPAEQIYGKTMSLPDHLIIPYLNLCTDVPAAEVEALEQAMRDRTVNPRDVKARLARELVALYAGGQEAAQAAEDAWNRVFRQGDLPAEMPEVPLAPPVWGGGPLSAARLVQATGLAKSGSEARRLIEQGGVRWDGERLTDASVLIEPAGAHILQVGRRRFARVTFLRGDVG